MSTGDQLKLDFFAWAMRRGILTASALRDAPRSTGDASAIPFTDAQAEYFRTRPIMRIRLEESFGKTTLKVSTRQAIAKRKQDELERVFNSHFKDAGVTLDITTAPSYKIDQSVATLGPTVRRRDNKVTCGSSVGIGNQRNAGTLTALARRITSGELVGLSCNHVIGGCSTTVPGTPIVVPGIQDVTAEDPQITVVGTFSETASMRQGIPTVTDISDNADLACFELDSLGCKVLTSWHGNNERAYDTPAHVLTDVPLGTIVQKWGRSTAWTSGKLTSILTDPEPVEYSVVSYFSPQASQTFKGTIYFQQVYEVTSIGQPFSAAGDSGSLVVTLPQKEGQDPFAVGVVIAGGTTKSLVLPIQPMLDQLGLELVSQYPPPPRKRTRTRSSQ
jgi:hypothetical protein